MWKLTVSYHDKRKNPSEFLCESFDEGMTKLRTIVGRKSFRLIKVG